VRFIITMNMGSASNNLVHQITCDHPANSLEELLDELSENDFIICRQFYRKGKDPMSNTTVWEDRGDIILNTSAIGKAVVHIDFD